MANQDLWPSNAVVIFNSSMKFHFLIFLDVEIQTPIKKDQQVVGTHHEQLLLMKLINGG